MGEIAEMMLNGLMCEGCGEWMDDHDEPGFPRRCAGCAIPTKRKTIQPNTKGRLKTIRCERCKKWFASDAARQQHATAKHQGSAQ